MRFLIQHKWQRCFSSSHVQMSNATRGQKMSRSFIFRSERQVDLKKPLYLAGFQMNITYKCLMHVA